MFGVGVQRKKAFHRGAIKRTAMGTAQLQFCHVLGKFLLIYRESSLLAFTVIAQYPWWPFSSNEQHCPWGIQKRAAHDHRSLSRCVGIAIAKMEFVVLD